MLLKKICGLGVNLDQVIRGWFILSAVSGLEPVKFSPSGTESNRTSCWMIRAAWRHAVLNFGHSKRSSQRDYRPRGAVTNIVEPGGYFGLFYGNVLAIY